jgi:hypothetical protein
VKNTLPLALIAPLILMNAFALADCDDDHAHANALPQQVHEFFLTEAVFSNERGEYQPYIAADYRRHSADLWHTRLNVGLEYGVTDRLQVAVSIPWVAVHDADDGGGSGAGDLSAEIFYNVIPTTASIALSVAAGLVLPTGDANRGFGEDEEELELTMIMAGRAASVQWQFNLGGEWTEEQGELVYGLAMLPMQWQWTIVPTFELSGAGTDEDRELYATPGLHWRPAENAGLGFGLPVGLNSGAQRLRVMMYYTVEF